MRIGFTNIYAYRPHGHAAAYIAHLAKELGAFTTSLDCKGKPSTCYVREFKGTGLAECIKCSNAGLHTFSFDSSESLSRFWDESLNGRANSLVQSSSYTLTRIESFEQRSSPKVKRVVNKLSENAFKFYHAAKKWIDKNALDVVFLFNGRVDYNRAVLEACLDLGVTCITHERPLYGHGIILNRNSNCSSLEKIHNINKQYYSKPLNKQQILIASSLAAQRLLGGNPLEWKNYNQSPSATKSWPVKPGSKKILVCPSSKNELLGHPDWDTPWKNNTDALDYAVDNGIFQHKDLLVRFHPSWCVKFGAISAESCEEHYKSWCKYRNVAFIESSSKASTKDLIEHADVVILNGSNTILEAGMLGKPVICLGPSPYTYSGAAIDALSHGEIESLDLEEMSKRPRYEIAQSTLRYYYSKAAREPLFTDFVRSKTVTEYDFYKGANPQILLDLLSKKEIQIGDKDYANTNNFETETIDAFINKDLVRLKNIANWQWVTNRTEKLKVSRRGIHRFIDSVRNLSSKGV